MPKRKYTNISTRKVNIPSTKKFGKDGTFTWYSSTFTKVASESFKKDLQKAGYNVRITKFKYGYIVWRSKSSTKRKRR